MPAHPAHAHAPSPADEDDDDLLTAINPYRLAELVAGQPIPWHDLPDEDVVFRKLLGMPRAELFSVRHRSPVFAGMTVTPNLRLVPAPRDAALTGLRIDPTGLPVDEDLARVAIPNVSNVWLESLDLRARRRIVATLLPAGRLPGPDEVESGNWTPPDGIWKDPGVYILDAVERTDPDQGAVGDCYFIAALASFAFTHPTKIHRCTGNGPHTLRLHTRLLGWKEYTVSEKVPVDDTNHAMLYARSTDTGEIWPAVYEKAYAQYRAETTSDRPNYGRLSGGYPTTALHHLSGWPAKKWRCRLHSAAGLYDLVRHHSSGRRTIWPMVAWTHPKDDEFDCGLVDNHAYSVFGTLVRNGEKYIVLRNPWAKGPATVNVASGTWEGMTLGAGGLFALHSDSFRRHFKYLGVARD